MITLKSLWRDKQTGRKITHGWTYRQLNGYRPFTWAWWKDWLYVARCAVFSRYNRLYIPTLPPTYRDPDTLLLHSVMAAFCLYFESRNWTSEEIKKCIAEDDGTDEFALSWAHHALPIAVEEEAIYAWWQSYPNRPNPIDLYDYTRAGALASDRLEREQYEEENEMIRRVVAIRASMWS